MTGAGSRQHSDADKSHAHNRVSCWFVPPLPWAALTFVLVTAAGWSKTLPLIADSIAYRALALGQSEQVVGSIAGRILHPAFVRFVAWTLSLNIDQAFFVVDLIALAILAGTVAWILKHVAGFGALVLPLLFTPVLVREMFGLYYCQDLFYAALLGCFFVTLIKRRTWLALALLFPLYLARESTLLLAFVWAGFAWFESDFFVVGACAAVTLAGLIVSRMFASMGMPNIHQTNELVFLALKPPFDSLRNLLGLVLVPDEMRGMQGFTCPPVVMVHLPRYLRYGFTKQFGICYPDLKIPLHAFTLWLSLLASARPSFGRSSGATAVAPLWIAPSGSSWRRYTGCSPFSSLPQ